MSIGELGDKAQCYQHDAGFMQARHATAPRRRRDAPKEQHQGANTRSTSGAIQMASRMLAAAGTSQCLEQPVRRPPAEADEKKPRNRLCGEERATYGCIVQEHLERCAAARDSHRGGTVGTHDSPPPPTLARSFCSNEQARFFACRIDWRRRRQFTSKK